MTEWTARECVRLCQSVTHSMAYNDAQTVLQTAAHLDEALGLLERLHPCCAVCEDAPASGMFLDQVGQAHFGCANCGPAQLNWDEHEDMAPIVKILEAK